MEAPIPPPKDPRPSPVKSLSETAIHAATSAFKSRQPPQRSSTMGPAVTTSMAVTSAPLPPLPVATQPGSDNQGTVPLLFTIVSHSSRIDFVDRCHYRVQCANMVTQCLPRAQLPYRGAPESNDDTQCRAYHSRNVARYSCYQRGYGPGYRRRPSSRRHRRGRREPAQGPTRRATSALGTNASTGRPPSTGTRCNVPMNVRCTSPPLTTTGLTSLVDVAIMTNSQLAYLFCL